MSLSELEEHLRTELHRRAQAVRRYFEPGVRVLYGVEASAPAPIGSCTLIRVGETPFLVTAAHVVDWHAKTPFHVGGGSGIQGLTGEFIHTSLPPSGNRDDDVLDFAVLPLDPERHGLGAVKFIESWEMDLNPIDIQLGAYTCVGFPLRDFQVKRSEQRVEHHLMSVTGLARPELYDRAQVSPREHLAVGFDRKRVRIDGEVRTAQKPTGMSGGAACRCIPFEHLGTTAPGKLAGILTEHRPGAKAMIATRISLVIAALLQFFPELKSSVADPPSIKINIRGPAVDT